MSEYQTPARGSSTAQSRQLPHVDRRLSVVSTRFQLLRRTTTLRQHADYIRSDKTLRRDTYHARAILAEQGRDAQAYKNAKKSGIIPTFAGYFEGARRIPNMAEPSGLILLEQDKLGNPLRAAAVRDKVFENLCVALAYVSKSGDSVHIVVAVEPAPRSNDENHQLWDALRDAVSGLGANITPDKRVKDWTRIAYPAFDSDAKFRDNPTPFAFSPQAGLAPASPSPARKPKPAPVADAAPTAAGPVPEPIAPDVLADSLSYRDTLRAAFEHDTSVHPNTDPQNESDWDAVIASIGVGMGLDDDTIGSFIITHRRTPGHEGGKHDWGDYLARTIRSAREYVQRMRERESAESTPQVGFARAVDNADDDAKPTADAVKDVDEPTADNPDADTDAPEETPAIKFKPRDVLMHTFIKEHHAASLFGSAERLVGMYAEDLLLVEHTDAQGAIQGSAYLLDHVGLWHNDEPRLRAKLHVNERDAVNLAVRLDLDGPTGEISKETKALIGNRKSTLNTRTKTTLEHIPSVPQTWGLKRLPIRNKLTFAKMRDMDTAAGFIGTPAGVVSLKTGVILPRSEGRRALITMTTDTRFNPDAHHPDVDKLTAHLGADVSAYLWKLLGRALWGLPECFVFLVGGTQTGKSTLGVALKAALGQYFKPFSRDLVRPEKNDNSRSGPTPERQMLVGTRLGFAHETEGWELDDEKLKTFTSEGADLVTIQPKYKGEYEARPTATLFFVSNQPPRLNKWTPPVFGRFIAIPFTLPNKPDREMKRRVTTSPDVAQAVLARLVREARDNPPSAIIPMPQEVEEFRLDLRSATQSNVGRFVECHVERDPNGFLVLADAWQVYCQMFKEEFTTESSEDGARKAFTRDLRYALEITTRAKQKKIAGEPKRGFFGFRLATLGVPRMAVTLSNADL